MQSVRALRVAIALCALLLASASCQLPTRESVADEPVTITHTLGSTTIDGAPKRIVALGNQWLDTAQALGVVPVGYIAPLPGSEPPWQPASLAAAKSLDTTGNMTEQVAALEPDLILVDGFLADQQTFDELSEIAPTLPALTKEVTPWQDHVTALGTVLHRKDDAARVIADVDKRIEAIGRANPGLKGKTFVSTWLASPAQLMVLTDPNDGFSKTFSRLGMSIPQNLTEMPASQGRIMLSPERIDELTADLVLAGYSPGMDEKYRQLPGYADLPAVRKGSIAFLTVQEISAINQPTALSVPHLLNKLEPVFAAAAK